MLISALEKHGMEPQTRCTVLHDVIFGQLREHSADTLDDIGILGDLVYWTCAQIMRGGWRVRPCTLDYFEREVEFFRTGVARSGINRLYLELICSIRGIAVPKVETSQYLKAESRYYVEKSKNVNY